MIGTYSPANYTNTYDTIQLETNNIYNRRVYDRNKKLVLKTKRPIRSFLPPIPRDLQHYSFFDCSIILLLTS